MARTRKTHKVARGCLEGSGPTKREALIDLNKQVDWACHYHPTHIESYFGHVIVITANSYGYSSTVVHPDQMEHGTVHGCRVFCGREPIEKEIRRMRIHVAQLAWDATALADGDHLITANLDDEGTRELASWIKFQRLYAEHKKAGATDGEAHERACRGEPVKEAV